MTRYEIIQGLQFTIEMFLYDPITGETINEPRNDMDKTTIDACKGAIELLKQESYKDEIIILSKALMGIADYECCDYGYTEAFDIAERITKEMETNNG